MASVFGPVVSWRLGRSLGVDLAPFKTCNWNCVYCQLGRSWPVTDTPNPRPPANTVLADLEERLRGLDEGEVDWITILGSGEPLLSVGLREVLNGIRNLSALPVAVLTDGALLSRPSVRDSVMAADVLMPSLCTGTAGFFKRLNRPHPRIPFEQHLEGLRLTRAHFRGRIWLEVMLVAGANDGEDALQSLARVMERVGPDEIHLNVPSRPPVEPWVNPPSPGRLCRAREILSRVAPVRLRGEGPAMEDCPPCSPSLSLSDLVPILYRHPMTVEEMKAALEPRVRRELKGFLSIRYRDGTLKPVTRLGKEFWVPGKAHFPADKARAPYWLGMDGTWMGQTGSSGK